MTDAHDAAQPPQPQREGLRELLIGAFEAGAMAVHEHWQKNPGPAQNGDPEFGEAARDCADDLLSTLPAAASVEAGEIVDLIETAIDEGMQDEGWTSRPIAERVLSALEHNGITLTAEGRA